MKSVTITVDGMRCTKCAQTITSLVGAQAGVHAADVSFEERQARVLYDPQIITEERLIDTIQKPGFRAAALNAS